MELAQQTQSQPEQAGAFQGGAVVRPAKKAEMEQVRQMIQILFPRARSKILPQDRFLVAERSGVLVGFCHYRLRRRHCYIAGLGVLAQYRNRGIGSRLLAEAVYRAEKSGALETRLKVRALNTATKLYLRMGFFEKRCGDVLLLVRKREN
ncbi:MAG: GNAT family N-acetyltransferase [Candidatus Micrarchaeota archaeon]|nr:GNAT family N-acetyltransferase [Candidatus Micrarchaeota archaeon]